jgi:GNAT superfamily N-acetyltransferase
MWRLSPRRSDITAVPDLLGETGFFSQEEQRVASELVQDALSLGSASDYQFVLIDAPGDPGKLLAYACFGHIPMTLASHDLYWIAVAPSQQGKGLGGKALHEAERRAALAGAKRMYADTSGREQYAPTRAFYERMGYEKAAVLNDFFAPGDDKIIYVRTL